MKVFNLKRIRKQRAQKAALESAGLSCPNCQHVIRDKHALVQAFASVCQSEDALEKLKAKGKRCENI